MVCGCALVGSIIGVILPWLTLTGRVAKTMILSLFYLLYQLRMCYFHELRPIGNLSYYRRNGNRCCVDSLSFIHIGSISRKISRTIVSLISISDNDRILAAYLMNFVLLKQAEGFSSSILWITKDIWHGSMARHVRSKRHLHYFFLIVIFFIPESPRWLIVQRKEETAKSIFSKSITTKRMFF